VSPDKGRPLERVLILDNYDSFTRNIAEGFFVAGAKVVVHRADAIDLAAIEAAAPELLVISPGPGRPEDATLSLAAISKFAGTIPIFGICLGHQCLAFAFGGKIERAPEPVHGKTSWVFHGASGLFEGLPSPCQVGRYHSLLVTEVPAEFEVSGRTAEGLVMGLRHKRLPLAGLQFHPDSFLTTSGARFFENALHARF